MEKIGALEIFKRSLARRKLRYIKYLGDGDTKAFDHVRKANPYGSEVDIQKIECINHVSKRVGRKLRSMKNRLLDDKKKLFGLKRINKGVIKKLQSYYSKAIRDNIGNFDGMKKAVWATYYHHSMPNSKSGHRFCPENDWCFYKNNQVPKKLLCPPVCIKAIKKDVYDVLGSDELIKRCVDGLTQNVNEGVHSMIWYRFPKSKFAGMKSLKIALYDTIICFNDGYVSREKLFDKLGFEAGVNMKNGLKQMDEIKEKRRGSKSRMKKKKRNLVGNLFQDYAGPSTYFE